MRPLFFWLLAAILGFSILTGSYHFQLLEHPRQLLVIVDASQPMAADWQAIEPMLNQLNQRRYTVFSLATEKDLVHDWSSYLALGLTRPRAGRDFSRLRSRTHLDLDSNPEVLFITNAEPLLTAEFSDWHIVRPGQPLPD